MHMIIEGRKGCPDKLQDLDNGYRFLDGLVDEIKMTRILPPFVTRYYGTNPDDWGISGFIMIAESHISMHTFPEHCEASIDVAKTLNFIKKQFNFDEVEYVVIERGLEFREKEEMNIVAHNNQT